MAFPNAGPAERLVGYTGHHTWTLAASVDLPARGPNAEDLYRRVRHDYMTAIVVSTGRHPSLLAAVPRVAVRAALLGLAVCILVGAGIAAATKLSGSMAQPTQSQQPSITSPASG